MKKISKKFYGTNSVLIGNQNAPYRWFVFGYRMDAAVVIFMYAEPGWLARRVLKMTLGSDWFEVLDPSFVVVDTQDPNTTAVSAEVLEMKPPGDIH